MVKSKFVGISNILFEFFYDPNSLRRTVWSRYSENESEASPNTPPSLLVNFINFFIYISGHISANFSLLFI